MSARRMIGLGAFAAAVVCGALDAHAVRLDPESGGQALIYPYYTVRSYGTDPFNTYISIVNTSADGKALRVRFREGREGLETLGLNLFLSPNDTWTAALIPTNDGGTQLISADRSCATYTGPADATGVYRQPLIASSFAGDGVDRTREGYVEVFEMGTVKGSTLAAIMQDASGVPHDCGAVQLRPVDTADIGAPSGGLQGTLTLINVASGMDATVNADALADLASKPYYRAVLDPYPDWNIAEIDPVSVTRTPAHAYRLVWPNALQAVSSVLMRASVNNEYVLDSATAASTDWVLAMPTRRLHVAGASVSAPFQGSDGCQSITPSQFNREAQMPVSDFCAYMDPCIVPPPPAVCAAATVATLNASSGTHTPLFGSKSPVTVYNYYYYFSPIFQNGALRLRFSGAGAVAGLVSTAASSRLDLATGTVETGSFRVQGVPVTGFMARAFTNGTLSCGGSLCQGNYASAFGHHGSPSIGPAQ